MVISAAVTAAASGTAGLVWLQHGVEVTEYAELSQDHAP
jgi:hypothetical protein